MLDLGAGRRHVTEGLPPELLWLHRITARACVRPWESLRMGPSRLWGSVTARLSGVSPHL
jgi:hypothetical protein